MSRTKADANKNDLTIEKVKEFMKTEFISNEDAQKIAYNLKELSLLLFEVIHKNQFKTSK